MTVPGALVVPAGSSCVLDNVTIEGQTRVMAGADLIITNSTINDAVFVNDDGYFDATDSAMAANVTNRAAYGVYVEDSSIGGGYFGRDTAGGDNTYAYALDTEFQGRVQVEQGEIYLDSSQVAGHMVTEGTSFTDLLNSTLERSLTVSGSDYGATVCESEVHGAVTFTGNNGPVGLGTGVGWCDEVNYFGAHVAVDDNVGGVDVTGNIIRGDLTGNGNDPAPVGSDNRVRGELGGQFADLTSDGPSISLQSEDPSADPQHGEPKHSDLVIEKLEERREDAHETASEIGPANL